MHFTSTLVDWNDDCVSSECGYMQEDINIDFQSYLDNMSPLFDTDSDPLINGASRSCVPSDHQSYCQKTPVEQFSELSSMFQDVKDLEDLTSQRYISRRPSLDFVSKEPRHVKKEDRSRNSSSDEFDQDSSVVSPGNSDSLPEERNQKRRFKNSVCKPTRGKKLKRYEEEPTADPEQERARVNAIMAKENRERKKKEFESLRNENEALKKQLEEERERIAKLEKYENEMVYLKKIVENKDSIQDVVQKLGNSVTLTSPADDTQGDDMKSGGICVHIANGKISVKLCSRCSKME